MARLVAVVFIIIILSVTTKAVYIALTSMSTHKWAKEVIGVLYGYMSPTIGDNTIVTLQSKTCRYRDQNSQTVKREQRFGNNDNNFISETPPPDSHQVMWLANTTHCTEPLPHQSTEGSLSPYSPKEQDVVHTDVRQDTMTHWLQCNRGEFFQVE